mgnify:CR=1 FL=1|jgi:DNA invertase Pin-like site-specific DNA recombinase
MESKKVSKSIAFETMLSYNDNRNMKGVKEMEVITRKRKPTGRPPINPETKDLVVRLYNEDTMTCVQIAKACNISKASVFRILNERRQKQNGEKE